MKAILFGCAALIAGIVIGGAITFLGSKGFQSTSQMTPQSSTRPDLSVTATAPFVAAQLQQLLRSTGVTKDAAVALAAPNLLRISSTQGVRVLGFPISINAVVTMSVTVQDGRIVLKTESVDATGISVPQSLIDSIVEPARVQAEDQLNRIVQNGLRGSNLRITNIRVTANDVTAELSGP